MAILISDKIKLESKFITRGKEAHYVVLNGPSRGYKNINIYVPNFGASAFLKQTSEPNGKIDRNFLIVRDLNIPLSIRDRSFSQKINKETSHLNYSTDQLHNRHIWNILSTALKYTLFSSTHRTIFRIDPLTPD